MRSEDVVQQQSKQPEAQDLPRILPQIRCSLTRRDVWQTHQALAPCVVSMIQARVSLASFDAASSVAASVYTRRSGSVPERRNSTHEPSLNSSFKPSVR